MSSLINRKYLKNLKSETEKRKLQERIEVIAQLIITDVLLCASNNAENTTCDIIVSNYVEEIEQNFIDVITEIKNFVDDVSVTLKTFDFVTKGHDLQNVFGEHREIGEENKLVIYGNRHVRYILKFDWS